MAVCISEFKALRDENARLIAKDRKSDAEFVGLEAENDGLKAEITVLKLKVDVMTKKLAYYENPHSPPSTRTIPGMKRAGGRRNRAGSDSSAPAGSSSRAPRRRHPGTTRRLRPDRKESHTPDECSKCGRSDDLTVIRTTVKNVVDIPVPKTIVTQHTLNRCKCGHCGAVTAPAEPGIRGTEMGPVPLGILMQLYGDQMTLSAITRHFNKVLGYPIGKASINNALTAVQGRIKGEIAKIRRDLEKSEFLHMDETQMRVRGRNCWVWLAVGRSPNSGRPDAVLVHVSGSRGAAVIDMHFPYHDMKLTADGLTAYRQFAVLQRCRAHILRDAETAAEDSRELHVLYEALFHDAKLIDPGPHAASMIPDLAARAAAIADRYLELECKFGTKLKNAVSNLFTFVLYPGMEPTNNIAERTLRPVVTSRKVRLHLMSTSGMERFGDLMSWNMTNKARGISPFEAVQNLLSG